MTAPVRLRPGRWWWDAVALARPTLLIPLWTMHVLGAAQASHSGPMWAPTTRFVALAVAHTFLIASAYIVNQLTDVETDAANDKLFLLAGGLVSRRLVFAEVAILAMAAPVILLLAGAIDRQIAAVFVASAGLGFAYSVPPLRLKALPVADLVANAAGYGGLAFAVGWLSVAPLSVSVLWPSVTYVLCVGATFMFTTIPDIEGDAKAGARTSGVALGAAGTAWCGVALLGLAVASAVVQGQWHAAPAACLALPLYIRSAIRISRHGGDASLPRATQLVILALTAAAAVAAPAYIALIAVVIVWVRWYYRVSFGVRYP
jgi:lycopene elongase/hydratase (dihydrobisanhydrobacterioruberin-forming)